MSKSFPCPRCGRTLRPSGEVAVDAAPAVPVYQCDECLVSGVVLGVKMETAFTFCVDAKGHVFKPTDPDSPLN